MLHSAPQKATLDESKEGNEEENVVDKIEDKSESES